jgi:hypothetical protein
MEELIDYDCHCRLKTFKVAGFNSHKLYIFCLRLCLISSVSVVDCDSELDIELASMSEG